MMKKKVMILIGISGLMVLVVLSYFQYLPLLTSLSPMGYMGLCIILFGAVMFFALSIITDDYKETKR